MPNANPTVSLDDLPGHHIRRLQQTAVGIFLDETADFGITPVQFALLVTASNRPGLDQRTLAGAIGFDTSTIGAVLDRLEARGLVRRNASATDRRVRLLTVTDEGRALIDRALPAMLRAQTRMLEPLDAAERQAFLTMVKRITDANQAWSRAVKDV